MKILLVDEQPGRSSELRAVLATLGMTIAGTATTEDNALALLANSDFDLMVTSLRLAQEHDTLALAIIARQRFGVPVVFIAEADTAAMKRSVTAMPSGYLQAPFDAAAVHAVLQLAVLQSSPTTTRHTLPGEQQQDEQWPRGNYLFIKDNHMFVRIDLSEVRFLKADGNYLELHTNTRKHLVRGSLKEFSRLLPPEYFVQVHRSYIVNTRKVERFGATQVSLAGIQVPIGSAYKEAFASRFRTF